MVIWIVIVVVHDVILFIFRENDVFHVELDEVVNIMDWLIIKVQTLITLFSYSLHFPIGKMTLGGLWNGEAAANKSPSRCKGTFLVLKVNPN